MAQQQQQTYETEMIKNMYSGVAKDLIAHLEKNGALKIDAGEAYALLGVPKKVPVRKQLTKEEKIQRAEEKQRKAEEREAAKLAREQAKAEKAAEKLKRTMAKAAKGAAKLGKQKMKVAVAAAKAASASDNGDAANSPKKVKKVKVKTIPAGHTARPKGRSPKGKTWNSETGEWVEKEE